MLTKPLQSGFMCMLYICKIELLNLRVIYHFFDLLPVGLEVHCQISWFIVENV